MEFRRRIDGESTKMCPLGERENSTMNKIPTLKSVQQNRRSLKMILSDPNCFENFRKTYRKNPTDFTSDSSSKWEPLHRWFLLNFPNRFQNSFFYTTLLISCSCISLHYLVFQEITSVTSVCWNNSRNIVDKYEIFHNLEKQFTIIISLWRVMV